MTIGSNEAAALKQHDAETPIAESDAERAWRRHARYALVLLFVVSVVSILDRYILSILLEPIKTELQVGDTEMGFLLGLSFALFNALATIPLARLSDRYSRKLLIAVSLGAWSLLTAFQGLARSFTTLALARIGVGIGEATTTPAAHSLIADYFPPERRASAVAVFTTGGHTGLMLGLVCGGILYELMGWRMTLIVVGLPGLLLALLVAFSIREPRRGANGSPLADVTSIETANKESAIYALRRLWSKRTYRHLAAMLPLLVFTNYAINIWGAAFLIRVHGWGVGEVGIKLGMIVGICGAAGNIVGANLCDRLGRRDIRWHLWLPALAALTMLPALFGFLFLPGGNGVMLCLGLVIFLISFHVSPLYSLALGLASPQRRATASALLHMMSAVFAAGIGPFVVGILNDQLQPFFGEQAVRYSLLLIAATVCWGCLHAWWASQTVREELRV